MHLGPPRPDTCTATSTGCETVLRLFGEIKCCDQPNCNPDTHRNRDDELQQPEIHHPVETDASPFLTVKIGENSCCLFLTNIVGNYGSKDSESRRISKLHGWFKSYNDFTEEIVGKI